jgi:hypothetical protein
MTSPTDNGLLAWAFDPALCDGQVAPADAEVYLIGVNLRFPMTITNVHCFVGVAGATVTASFGGLYDADGVRLGVTGSANTALQSTGFKTLALTAPVAVEAGWHYIALLSGGGGTDCQLNIGGAPTVSAINAGITAIDRLRFATHNAGSQATLPTTVVPEATGALPFWAAVS